MNTSTDCVSEELWEAVKDKIRDELIDCWRGETPYGAVAHVYVNPAGDVKSFINAGLMLLYRNETRDQPQTQPLNVWHYHNNDGPSQVDVDNPEDESNDYACLDENGCITEHGEAALESEYDNLDRAAFDRWFSERR